MPYKPTYLPDGRKAYNPQRTERDIQDEKDAFAQQLRDEGWTDEIKIYFKAIDMWMTEERENSERWSQWQQRVFYPRMRRLQAEREAEKEEIELTAEEWEYLNEVFENANHPVAQSIHRKASRRGTNV